MDLGMVRHEMEQVRLHPDKGGGFRQVDVRQPLKGGIRPCR